MQVEGIPDGWELVRVGKVKQGEFFILSDGSIEQHDRDKALRMNKNYVIIRKIEKPKRFRAFANAAEADAMWNAVLKFKNQEPGMDGSRCRINFIAGGLVGIGQGSYTYKEAFRVFECIDGTPFGVEVTE